jgi:hypothetical protein
LRTRSVKPLDSRRTISGPVPAAMSAANFGCQPAGSFTKLTLTVLLALLKASAMACQIGASWALRPASQVSVTGCAPLTAWLALGCVVVALLALPTLALALVATVAVALWLVLALDVAVALGLPALLVALAAPVEVAAAEVLATTAAVPPQAVRAAMPAIPAKLPRSALRLWLDVRGAGAPWY